MKTSQHFLKLLAFSRKSKGFTLIELLVAILMGGIVMTGLGIGMMALLNNGKATAAKTDVKNQLNRAVDYLNEDIKMARYVDIEQDGDGINTTLVLTQEQDDGSELEIRYYLVDANNPWLGPKVLVRKEGNSPYQVLVDRLTENAIAVDDFVNCVDPDPNVLPKIVGTALNLGGFQACVQEGAATNESQIYRTRVALFGEITDVNGTDGNSTVIKVTTDITSRSVIPLIDPPIVTFPIDNLTPTLEWEPVDSAASYEIYKCFTTDPINECTPNTLIGSTTSTTFAEPDADLPGSRACYAGKTLASPQESKMGPIRCTIMSPENAPDQVTGLTASDELQPVVDWDYDNTAISYKLYRCTTTTAGSECSIDPSVDTPIDTFSTVTEIDFNDNVPWSEAIHTNNRPIEGQGFCYAVVATNARGDSPLSNIDCGRFNNTLTLNASWSVAFTNFTTTQIQPTGVTWNTVAGATRYEVRRCSTTSWTGTCDPVADGIAVVDNLATNINPFQYDEVGLPAPDSRYCYAVRAKNDTQYSNFSATSCGKGNPPECTLDMSALGLGSTVSYKSAATATDRQTLLNLTNSFFNAPVEVVENKNLGNVLHTVEYQNSSGTYTDARNSTDSRRFPCDTQLRFKWFYTPPGTMGIPQVTLTPGNPITKSNLSWTAVTGANQYRIYRCETDQASCTPSSGNLDTPLTTITAPTTTYNGNAIPSKLNRFCYVIVARDTVPNPDNVGAASATVCGNLNP